MRQIVNCEECNEDFVLPAYDQLDTLTESVCADCIASMTFITDEEISDYERERKGERYCDTRSDSDADYRDCFSER